MSIYGPCQDSDVPSGQELSGYAEISYVDKRDHLGVFKAGDTMSGTLIVNTSSATRPREHHCNHRRGGLRSGSSWDKRNIGKFGGTIPTRSVISLDGIPPGAWNYGTRMIPRQKPLSANSHPVVSSRYANP